MFLSPFSPRARDMRKCRSRKVGLELAEVIGSPSPARSLQEAPVSGVQRGTCGFHQPEICRSPDHELDLR